MITNKLSKSEKLPQKLGFEHFEGAILAMGIPGS